MKNIDISTECLDTLYKSLILHADSTKQLKESRKSLISLEKKLEETERKLEAIQTVGQTLGEVVCELHDQDASHEIKNNTTSLYANFKSSRRFVVKSSLGPKYIVGIAPGLANKEIVNNTRVALDATTLTIIKVLPKEIDPTIHLMAASTANDKTKMSFKNVGGLEKQIVELREVIELPLTNPEVYKRIGIKPPKGVLLYGPPGTGKTLLAKAVAASLDVTFLKVVGSSLIEKYIGESSRMIRELFAYARTHSPSIIFIDEIDAIGGKRTGDSNSCDREVQRTLMELLNQMDGFSELDKVKVIMATNRPDILDEALLRPGRLDRKIEIPLPGKNSRKEILKIYIAKDLTENSTDLIYTKDDECIDLNILGKLTEGFNGADLRHMCTEAGYFAMRDDREFLTQEDFVKAARKIGQNKKVETKLEYTKQ